MLYGSVSIIADAVGHPWETSYGLLLTKTDGRVHNMKATHLRLIYPHNLDGTLCIVHPKLW